VRNTSGSDVEIACQVAHSFILECLPQTEKSLISGIRSKARLHRGIELGIGDDCAILRVPPNHETLVTTDLSLEGVHFRQEWHPPEVVGHRSLARGLSDIAAMGGQPIAAFLSLAVPRNIRQNWVDGFLKGLLKLADDFHVSLAGGDTAESPRGISVDIVVVGSVPKSTAVRRSGARPGDRIFVTGDLGSSAATLNLLFRGRSLRPKDFPHHFHPVPRVDAGRFLRERALASAMIDISDGLSTDLAHICEESNAGAAIQAKAIPRTSIGRSSKGVDLKFALHGGDDYELLFTARLGKHIPTRIAGVPITEIGSVTRAKGMVLIDDRGVGHKLRPQGWQHFQR
jgi:thiamine-monophosphate kinase